MNEKFKNVLEKTKVILKHVTIYTVIISSCIASFFLGFYYQKNYSNDKKDRVVKIVSKEEVNLAVDVSDNLIIIDNKTGDYTIYEDSIGNTIFKLYAKNIWGQHNQSLEQNK